MQVQRHAPIREQVAAILRQAIVEMRLPPGKVLIERELCELTSASRPSVREALRQLEAEGLVDSVNGRGTIVSAITPSVARQVYDVRANLEGLAARLFAVHADEAQRAALLETMARLSASVGRGDDAATVMAVKNDLYAVLFAGAGNQVLHQLVQTLHRRVTQLRALTLAQPGRPAQSESEIRAIVDAIADHDPEGAEEAASRHVRTAAAVVLDGMVLDEANGVA
ncbi:MULTISPECIES: GntR family transcriptional regulator [unclassified Modestobacter]